MVSTTLFTASCGDKKTDPQAQPQTGILRGEVAPAGSITTVVATDATGQTFTAIPTSTGSYSFPNLVVGTYTLTFIPAAGYVAPAAATVALVTGGTTVPTTAVAALVVTATLSGQVAPAGSIATVTAIDVSGRLFTVTPTSTGAYSFPNLAVGSYTLAFTPTAGYVAPAPASATLVAGGTVVPTTTVALLVVTGTLSGQVVPAGSVLQVTATSASGATMAVPTGTGAYAFPALPVGAYTLSFTPTPSYVAPAPVAATLVAAGTTAATVTLTAARNSATFSVNGSPVAVAFMFQINNAGLKHLRFSADPNGSYGPTVFLNLDWVTPTLSTFALNTPSSGSAASYTGRDFISYHTGAYTSASAAYVGTVTITYIDPLLRRFSGTFNYIGGNPTISSPSGILPAGTAPSVAITGTFNNFSY